MLLRGRSTISAIPEARWSVPRYLHPGRPQAGWSYTNAAGVLDAPFDFDVAHFRLSRREAEQMDPQQRLLLETTARAFDHAAIDPADLDRQRTGVFVGASASDHSTTVQNSPAPMGPHFMLGNTLSILANRLSHAWDLQGPSLTVDTACSSALVALDIACRAIARDEIDTAVVAGVNLLLSPIPFIGFSQATMLSPRGLCTPFAAGADGYVRGEGVVAFILQRRRLAQRNGLRIRSTLQATAVNSDGRTTSLPLPSSERQAALIDSVLARTGLDPDDFALIEAHGTGTPVGDPREAWAIGTTYGQRRKTPLPLGSAKANFGHLEPAAGLVGLLKAQLCLEHGFLPMMPHAETPHPEIDFHGLNLRLPRTGEWLRPHPGGWCAAVNAFGFGGTNAHAVLRQETPPQTARGPAAVPPALLITAASATSLKALAESWQTMASHSDPRSLAASMASANHRLARHAYRACFAAGSASGLTEAITAWRAADRPPVRAAGDDLPVGFVFSGNGTAWPGMARDIFAADRRFRDRFRAVAAAFRDLGLDDPVARLFDDDLAARLDQAEIAQPLIFACQLALVETLAHQGLRPAAVLGHSVGECAAAAVAGRLEIPEAARLIAARCAAAAPLHGSGTMAALNASLDVVGRLIEELGLPVEIAAENAPANVTVSGPFEAVEALLRHARKRRVSGLRLDIAYPYHSSFVERLGDDLIRRLGPVATSFSGTGFFSGWAGQRADDVPLDAAYWQANARQRVNFRAALAAMAEEGIGVFLEISPRSVLAGNMRDTLAQTGRPHAVCATLRKSGGPENSAAAIARAVLCAGGRIDEKPLLGPRRRHSAPVPDTPFARETLQILPGAGFAAPPATPQEHDLLGRRSGTDGWIWKGGASLTRLPWLADHRVNGDVLLPAMAMLDMFRHAAEEITGGAAFDLRDIAFLKPVVLDPVQAVALRLSFETLTRRLTLAILDEGTSETVAQATLRAGIAPLAETLSLGETSEARGLYPRLAAAGLAYGPHFARLDGISRPGEHLVDLTLDDRADPGATAARICRADAALHGLAALLDTDRMRVPYRIARARFAAGGAIAGARLSAPGDDAQPVGMQAVDATGRVVLHLEGLALVPLPEPGRRRPAAFDEIALPLRQAAANRLRPPHPAPDSPAAAEPSDLDVARTALAGRLAWDLVLDAPARKNDPRCRFAADWLTARGLARDDDQDEGLRASAACPWPTLDALLVLLAQGIGDAADELAAALQAAVAGDPAQRRPLARARRCAVRLLRAQATPPRRILLAGDLDPEILQAARQAGHHVTVAAPDHGDLRRITARLGTTDGYAAATIEDLASAEPFDLVIGISALTLHDADLDRLAGLCRSATETWLIDERPDAFAILTHRYATPAAFAAALRRFGPLTAESVSGDSALVVHHGRILETRRRETAGPVQVVGTDAFALALAACAGQTEDAAAAPIRLVVLPPEATAFDRFEAMRADSPAQTTWIIARTADRIRELTGLRRVICNETQRDLRLGLVAGDVAPEDVLAALAGHGEPEIRIDHTGIHSLRLTALRDEGQPGAGETRRLVPDRTRQGGAPVWALCDRQTPRAGEIEIAVEATGLNFRDIMLASGALPEEAFLGGYAGLDLGIECAGTVLRCGPDSRHAPGDRVATFAAGAFATHVTVPQDLALALPPGLPAKAAATLPVAFLTADYALRECARLAAGESVLIHGGAGGVGTAALQIAQSMGLKVMATAGSPEKRRLLTALGAAHVFDSRTLDFADELRAATAGRGVDAVINALAGPFVEASLDCLAPFGRFVELGKRDLFENTPLGLRALRQNIAFFAVDADQLVRERPGIARRVLARLSEGFQSGRLNPLPHAVFAAADHQGAFDRMRRAEHIGKIVLAAPDHGNADAPAAPDYRGAWLVTGGTRGFGLATAGWLAARGATVLWLVSRSGALDPTERRQLEAQGARVHSVALDIADRAAVEALADSIRTAEGRLQGVVHAAMVLDDAPAATLDRARFDAVLRPKIDGACHLDAATRSLDPAHFWLYSSVAVRLGNPGQAAYVAANGALEDLAQRRAAEGLPALAIAWPPIRDAGYLQGQSALRDRIETSGMPALAARDALDRLHKALCTDPRRTTITLAPADWARVARSLPALQGPLLELMQTERNPLTAETADIGALIAQYGAEEAERRIIAILLAEFALLLRLPEDRMDQNLTLGEIGFDSLLGMQLRLTIEDRLGQSLPVNALSETMTVARLARLLVEARTAAPIQTGALEEDPTVRTMIESHLADDDVIARLRDAALPPTAEALP